MKLEGAALCYLIAEEFGDVEYLGRTRAGLFDYPILYDEGSDMSGHVILVPAHERPDGHPAGMAGVLCVCLGKESAHAAHEGGCDAVIIPDGVTFQRLFNFMQSLHCPCALIDAQYRTVCSEGWRRGEVFGSESVDLFMASREYRYMRSSRKAFVIPGSDDVLMKNVFADGKLVGTLVMPHEGTSASIREVASELLERLCDRDVRAALPRPVGSDGRWASGATGR